MKTESQTIKKSIEIQKKNAKGKTTTHQRT